jgi:hypothetical protein
VNDFSPVVPFIYTHIRFDASVQVTTTDVREGTAGDPNSAGTIVTAKQKLFSMDNKQIGVGQWMKIVTVSFFNIFQSILL